MVSFLKIVCQVNVLDSEVCEIQKSERMIDVKLKVVYENEINYNLNKKCTLMILTVPS